MDKRLRYALVILSVVFIMNIYLISKVNYLTGRVNNLNNSRLQLESMMRQSVNEVQGVVHQMQKEQEWITPVEVNVGEFIGDKRKVKLSWQIRDYPLGAPVIFNLQKSGENEFQEIKATSKGGGNFEVEIEVPQESEPRWEVIYHYLGERNADAKLERVAEEQKRIAEYKYYITVEDDGRLQSGQLSRMNLGKVAQQYVFLQVDARIHDDHQNYMIFVDSEKAHMQVKKMWVEVYQDEEIIERQEAEYPQPFNRPADIKWVPKDRKFDSVSLHVEYENGKKFSKEIWNTQMDN